jgi:hypothetical protein
VEAMVMKRTDDIPEKIRIIVEIINKLEDEALKLGKTVPPGWTDISTPPGRNTKEIELYFYEQSIHSDYISRGGYETFGNRFIQYDRIGEGGYCDWATAWRWKE